MWGHLDYKRLFAWLEGWKDYKEEASQDEVKDWLEDNGAKEPIQGRFIDSRYGSARKLQNDEPTTTITEFAEIGLHFDKTPGSAIADGLTALDGWLSYDAKKPPSSINRPLLRISEDCPNFIFAVSTYTGHDGQKAACGDFVDILRYFALLASDENGSIAHVEAKDMQSEFGFSR